MQDTAKQTIGSIALAWSQAEDAVADMAALYLDIDTLAHELLVKSLRPQDREKLLKAVVNAKEFDDAIKTEVIEAMKRTQICRENRNKILHGLGDIDGDLSEAAERVLQRVLQEIEAECAFLGELKLRLSAILFDRASRDVPNDEDQTGEDELRPLVEFEAPERPRKPKSLRLDEFGTA